MEVLFLRNNITGKKVNTTVHPLRAWAWSERPSFSLNNKGMSRWHSSKQWKTQMFS